MKNRNLIKSICIGILCSLFLLQSNFGFAQNCDCNEYLYVNDTAIPAIHKFSVDPTTGTLTEIGNPWSTAQPNPHGIGQDVNGNLYIADGGFNGGVDQIDAFGNLVTNDYLDIAGTNTSNFLVDGNTIYFVEDNARVTAYDICTGNEIGRINLQADGSSTGGFAWGLFHDENNIYVVSRNIQSSVFSVPIDLSLYTNPASNTGINLFNLNATYTAFTFNDLNGLSVTRDAAGNFYVIQDQSNSGAFNDPTIVKYSPTGAVLAQVTADSAAPVANATDGLPGWSGARGIVYSPSSNLLYVTSRENCVTVFDTNLNELSTLNIGNPMDGFTKGLGLVVECCPVMNTMTIDTALCGVDVVNEELFLQDLLGCKTQIGEGQWMPSGSNPASLAYDNCSQSISSTTGDECATYNLGSDGTGNNAQCGFFMITLNVCFNPIATEPAFSITDNDCVTGAAGTISVTTECTTGNTLEWSTDGGTTWSATAPTYDAITPVTVRARCTNDCDTAETADVTSAPEECCPVENCINQFGEFTITKRRP